ncbi:MAG TPA: DoxX-like family protein, partial [Candidatus Sulfotelmatobacter sp.]|nr:DoxX-like family protein [Candidatus Sulfotelmatobacter sp.]
MVRRGREEAPIAALLRVALGALWVYDGLVFKLLALNFGLTPGPAVSPVLALSRLAQLRLEGGLEVVVGLLLLGGRLVRLPAAAQCLLLSLLTFEYVLVVPGALARPLGVVSTNLVLFAASLALALIPTGRRESAAQEARLALILRLGLGLMWLYEGLVLKWLLPTPPEVELLARSGLVPAQVPAFVHALGVVEAVLGLSVLAGLWVRRLAVLQVGLLAILTLLLGWRPPTEVLDLPGGLSRHLAVIGCALVLYETGAGDYSLDRLIARSPGWRHRQLVALLTWGWLFRV